MPTAIYKDLLQFVKSKWVMCFAFREMEVRYNLGGSRFFYLNFRCEQELPQLQKISQTHLNWDFGCKLT